MSKLLVVAIIVATAATGALLVTALIGLPPGPPGGPRGEPPPPPDEESLAVFTIVTGFFVLAWLAVLVIFSRDQILRHLQHRQPPTPASGVSREELGDLLAGLRNELAADRERDLQVLREQISEYGDQRETDGYLGGMRAATTEVPPEPNVRSFRRTPPQR